MEFGWSEQERDYRKTVGQLLDDVLEETGLETRPGFLKALEEYSPEEQLRLGKTVCAKLAERNYLIPNWPPEYGGLGLTPWQAAILAEEVVYRGEPRGSQYMNANWIGPAIMLAGSPEQKDYFLNRIARGDITWCQGFSEPDAGTDLASLSTRAVRDGDEYIVNGEKIWTSHTPTAEYCFLLVRTDPAAERHDGISILLVPLSTPGFVIRPIEAMGGIHDSALANCIFEDMRVPVSARLGEENKGWAVVRATLAFERVGMPRWLNASVRLDELAAWLRSAGRLGEPGVAEVLGQARSWCEAGRVLYYAVVNERRKDYAHPSALSYAARAAMVRAERVVSEAALQLQAETALESSAIGSDYMEGIVAGLGGGSYEVQLNLISKMILKL